MKKIIIASVCIFLLSRSFSQVAFYGAKKISSDLIIRSGSSFKFDPDKIDILTAYLKAYLPDSSKNTSLSESQVLGKYEKNPFFGAEAKLAKQGGASASSSGIIKNAVSSLGGIQIPNEVLLGVTDWLVKRTKQELSSFFFENFKKEIEKYPDLRTVFPQTYRSLKVLGEEIYNYQKYLKSLRAAFQNDIRDLAKNLPTIITNHPDYFEKHPVLAATFGSGFYIAEALQDKIHPGDILNDYPAEFLDPLDPNWKGAIQTLQLFSASLRDTVSLSNTDSVYWVTPRQVKELVKDKIAFRIYLGLIYEQARAEYDSIHFATKNGDTTLVGILDKVGAAYDSVYSSYSGFITHFSEKTNKLNSLIKEYKKSGKDSSTFQFYYDYYTGALDFLQHCTEISKLPFIKERIPDLADTLEDYFEVARASADLFLNIKQHNYSSAIINTVHIYDMVKAIQSEKDAVNDNLTAAQRAMAKTFAPAKSNLFRYGSFFAAVAEAETPEEVEKIIETFALPPGSSRIKKESLFNVSLNAYCGLFVGNEIIKGIDPNNPLGKINSYGLTAPIGVTVNWGRKNAFPFSKRDGHKNNWSHSFFISVVDLGAVAAFRFTDNTADQVPSVKLKDIFSPGLFWSIGIPKSPLSVNLGAQVGPNLRKVTSSTKDYSSHTYVRYGLSVTVDLPVLNLYTKSK